MTSHSKSKSNPLRVTLLMDTPVWAGTESHVLMLARSLHDLKDQGVDGSIPIEVTVATMPDSPLWKRARAAGLPTIAIARRGIWDSDTLQTLMRRVRRGACDVVHAHNGRTALWGALAVKGARRGSCVFTHHFIEPAHAQSNGLSGQTKRRLHTILAAGIREHIAISQAVANTIIERGDVDRARVNVIHNGIYAPATIDNTDLPQELHAEIACVARLQKEKGLPTLVRALAILKAERPDVAARCVIAGEGNERASLEELIDAQRVKDEVHLAGFTPHIGAILNAAKVSVLPSPAEPFGLAVVEAMAQKRAVVAINAGGPREIVVAGETGLLVPPDDPPALARALAELLDNPARTEAMGRAGFERFETHFTAANMGRKTAEVYKKALDSCKVG